ncbi:MAG: hypothetical protein FWE90_13530 [Defluviitaleaceae bacterium]|nr:hypothetical protein [Defluviitaleaceae bacterium]
MSKDELVFKIQQIAGEHDSKSISKRKFYQLTRISEHHILRAGGWNELILAAGLKPNSSNTKKNEDELFTTLFNVCVELDIIPNKIEFERQLKKDATVYVRKFGGKWQHVLIAFRVWLNKTHPHSKFINMIAEKYQKNSQNLITHKKNVAAGKTWGKKKDVVYGSPLDFRGLRHEPTNEQGVVFLFGKIHEELGIIVESVNTGFPDCTGKRLIDKNKNHWEPVAIEFEYKSKNFFDHGHNVNGCDVIVCWIHDWHTCPSSLEVIELKEIIKSLKT